MSLNSLYCYHNRIVIIDRGIMIGGNQKIEEQRQCNKDTGGESLLIATYNYLSTLYEVKRNLGPRLG